MNAFKRTKTHIHTLVRGEDIHIHIYVYKYVYEYPYSYSEAKLG